MRHAANKYTLGIEIIFNPKKVLQNQNPLPLFILYPGIKSNSTANFIYWCTHLKKNPSEYDFIGKISHLPSVCKNGSDMKKLGRKGQEPSKKTYTVF